MISEKKLSEYQEKAEKYLGRFDGLIFDHFALGTCNADSYLKILAESGEFISEVNFHGRRIGTVRDSGGRILEILEPKMGQEVPTVTIDHIGYKTDNLRAVASSLEEQLTDKFDVGSTHGIKISPAQGMIIEIRNNRIVDSVADFSL